MLSRKTQKLYGNTDERHRKTVRDSKLSHDAFVTATAIVTLTDCATLTKMESEITERTGKPKDKIKNASKVIRTDIFMEEVQKYVCLYDKYSRDFKDRNMKVNCREGKVASKFDSTPQQAETKFRNVRTTYTKGFYERRRQYLLVLDGRPQKCSLSLRIWDGCLVILITKLSRTERPSAIVKDPQRPWKTLSDRERPLAIVKDGQTQ